MLYAILIILLIVAMASLFGERRKRSSAGDGGSLLEDAFALNPQAIILVRSDGTLAEVNHAACQLHQLRRSEMLLRSLQSLVHPEDQLAVSLVLGQCIKNHSASYRARHVLPNGDEIMVDVQLRTPSDTKHNRSLLFISPHIGTESSPLASSHYSQQEVLQRAASFSTLSEVVSGIAHELKQPLTAIANYAGACSTSITMNDQAKTPIDLEKIQGWLAEICDQTHHCGEIIGRLRKCTNQDQDEFRVLELNTLVHDCMALLRDTVYFKGVLVRFELPAESPRVFGSEVDLKQVLIHLLRNAGEATTKNDPGEASAKRMATGEASAKNEPGEVTIAVSQTDTHAMISVRDNGPGISESDRSQIFETFFTTKGQGLGVGLGISRSMMRKNRGEVILDTSYHGGAKFDMRLPLSNVRAD